LHLKCKTLRTFAEKMVQEEPLFCLFLFRFGEFGGLGTTPAPGISSIPIAPLQNARVGHPSVRDGPSKQDKVVFKKPHILRRAAPWEEPPRHIAYVLDRTGQYSRYQSAPHHGESNGCRKRLTRCIKYYQR